MLLVLSIISFLSPSCARAKSPQTVVYTAETVGGFVRKSGLNYAVIHGATSGDSYGTIPAYSIISTGHIKYGDGSFRIYRIFLRFDTSNLSKNIDFSSAYLSLYGMARWNRDYLALQRWNDGDDGLELSDYSAFDGVNYDDGHFHTNDWGVGAWNNITISDYRLITMQGYTDIVFRTKREVDAIPPTGNDYVSISVESPTMPKLYITYVSAPSARGLPPWEHIRFDWVGNLVETKVRAPVWALWVQGAISFEGVLFTLIFAYIAYRIAKFLYIYLFRAPRLPHVYKRGKKIIINVSKLKDE